ncbi:MAG TPA: indole-3-glycerol-phosphate synthase [Candidatus Limnocylindria bacterium]|nr:indole-3-glycerol-phosphate synthase [Candidatus Limnocylindria bacterium]
MSDFLEQVVAERRAYAERARATHDAREQKDNLWSRKQRTGVSDGLYMGPAIGNAFTSALVHPLHGGGPCVIAEVKRVSPALGTLNADVDPARQARRYVEAGACAISVLTEPNHWGGSLRDLEAVRDAVTVPVLAKDIIVSEIQIEEARAAGADAVLLIAEALSDAELRAFVSRARELSMGALVEAHEPVAFGRAVAAGSRTVGVNARDLRNPKVLDIGRVRQLHGFVRHDQVLVAESGISSADDVRLLPRRVGAVLVGTALMTADDPAPLIRSIRSARPTSNMVLR